MIKKLFSIALVAFAFTANAQTLKVGQKVQNHHANAKGTPLTTMGVLDTLYPASVATPSGCGVTGGLFNYINDYTTPYDSGYVFGTGIIPLGGTTSTMATELGQKYNITGAAMVTDVIVWAGAAFGGTVTTTANIYTENATTHNPNTLLGTSTPLPMSAYSVTGNTVFNFATPVNVSAGNFFAAVTVPAFGGADMDTLSVLCTDLGVCPPAGSDSCSAIKLGAPINAWYLIKVGFGVNGDLMIFPVIDITTGLNNAVSKGDLSLFAVSPNPSSNAVNINFSLNNSSKVDIEILDLTGKTVKTIKGTDTFSTGKHSITLDVTNLQSGSYIYSVNAAGTKMFSKFVVTK